MSTGAESWFSAGHVDTLPWVIAIWIREYEGGVEEWEGDRMEKAKLGHQEIDGEKNGKREGDGQSCPCWSTQASVLFDEDEVKC